MHLLALFVVGSSCHRASFFTLRLKLLQRSRLLVHTHVKDSFNFVKGFTSRSDCEIPVVIYPYLRDAILLQARRPVSDTRSMEQTGGSNSLLDWLVFQQKGGAFAGYLDLSGSPTISVTFATSSIIEDFCDHK